MKKNNYLPLIITIIGFSIFAGSCSAPAKNDNAKTEATARPDMAKIKTEIQAIATKWAAAEDARDANAVAAFYADDAVRLVNGAPMIAGKENILKSLKQELDSTPKAQRS